MKSSLVCLLCLLLFSCKKTDLNTDVNLLHDGDIIFQTSLSAQSKAIQLATHSKYSHCGIIYKEGNDFFVFEAIQPVKKTSLNAWIDRGKDGHYAVRRLKNSDKVLTPEALSKMKTAAAAMNGKSYDLYFGWSNERIYCSELVWKICKEGTGLEIGHLQKLQDFDLTNPVVQSKLKERYGNNIPKDEKVISPAVIYQSNLLETIIGEYKAP